MDGAHTAASLADRIRSGDRRSLARAISLVEDSAGAAPELLAALYPSSGRAHLVGVTGPPGCGKSTLASALAGCYRQHGRTVAIVAVDPSSAFTGGALLGDRVRMRALAGDPGVFIRSMATRGQLGGLASATGDVVCLLDAAGYERILIETVGVGQDEIAIATAAHTTIVVEAPGMGDDVQAGKAGVLEIGHIFAVNKADRDGADATAAALEAMLALAPAAAAATGPGAQSGGAWLPPVVRTVATTGEGVGALMGWVEAHREMLVRGGGLALGNAQRAESALEAAVRDLLFARFMSGPAGRSWRGAVNDVAARKQDPYTAAEGLAAGPRGADHANQPTSEADGESRSDL
jgi:LAO/AO transport system kinase